LNFESQYHWKIERLGSYKGITVCGNTQIQKRVKAQDILKDQIPFRKLDFKTTDTKNWRVLYKVAVSEENSTKIIEEKIKIYVRCYLSGFKLSLDRYSDTESFIAIQG
jgi:hypothetical protein